MATEPLELSILSLPPLMTLTGVLPLLPAVAC